MSKILKLGNEPLIPPRVVVSVTDREDNAVLASLRVDALELRVDLFARYDIESIIAQVTRRKEAGVPLILTVRNMPEEGGQAPISDRDKLVIFQRLISQVDAADIELRSPIAADVVGLAHANGKLVIVSSHNFSLTPADQQLEEILRSSQKLGADITKIAACANTRDDVNRLMAFTSRHRDAPLITMSLGAIGSISRLVFPSVGSLLTYTYLSTSSAPGQIQVHTLQGDLRRYYPEYDEHLIAKFRLPG